MRQLTLDLEQRTVGERTTFELGVHEEGPGTNAEARCLSFTHEGRAAEPLVLDGYLLAVLLYALEHVERVVVEGPLSAKALRNAHIWSEAWHSWQPDRYRPVEIVAETVVTEAELRAARGTDGAGRAIAAFSGGVDSTFLALRHATGMVGTAAFPVRDVVMVHGFDVDRDNTAAFTELRARTRPLTDLLGLRVHVLRTNAKDALPQHWERAHGALLACVLHQFSDRFEYGLLAGDREYAHPKVAWGSLPTTDYLLSGGDLEIVHEGAGYSRTEKVDLVASHPLARRTVMVCWEGPDQGRNCGVCEKCMRTRLNFMAVGVSAPECFDSPFHLDEISSIRVTHQLRSIRDYADRRGLEGEWVTLLRDRITEQSEIGSVGWTEPVG